mmetsp:Transcript_2911/g.4621  ORF Transcript_2911/g.4621 Transcript_2911/m.4621 type:complete len:232 (-) Transcript_2911:75-770(-)
MAKDDIVPPNHYNEDEILARDMQLAFELQAKEEAKARRKDMKRAARMGAQDGFDLNKLNADHMLFVSCILDGSQVQLLVDTGASSSAMSLDMVKSLGLESKLNRSVYGNAKGVGSSNIVGVVENVELLIGHVEFRLFFMVIDSNMPCCILGLDQMRRFKCQVDLDDNCLVFGGHGGVSVPFLAQDEARLVAQQMIATAEITTPVPASASLTQNNSAEQSKTTSKIKSLFNL